MTFNDSATLQRYFMALQVAQNLIEREAATSNLLATLAELTGEIEILMDEDCVEEAEEIGEDPGGEYTILDDKPYSKTPEITYRR